MEQVRSKLAKRIKRPNQSLNGAFFPNGRIFWTGFGLAGLLLLFAGLFFEVSLAIESPRVAASSNLSELIPGTDYKTFFESNNPYSPDDVYFGVYSLAPLADTLYMGFGAARPAESDGALLAAYDGDSLLSISALTEQGFIDMHIAAPAMIIIPGADPCCGDGWDWGNVYFYTHNQSNSFIKRRTLPNVHPHLGDLAG